MDSDRDSVVQIALLLTRHHRGGRLRVPGDSVFLALGSGLICLLVAAGMIGMPAPWARIMSVSDTLGAPWPWWKGTPDVLDGTTMVMTLSHGAVVAAAAALTSLISAIVSLDRPTSR